MRGRAVLVIAGIATLAVAAPARAATYTVTDTADITGDCSGTTCSSLRAAVTAANAAGGADAIKLDATRPYVLHNELPVTSDLTVAGTRADTTTIAEDLKSGRVFNVGTGGKLTVRHATLSNGVQSSNGGNVLAVTGTTLVLDHVRVTGGSAPSGGGIAVDPGTTVEISHSLIDGNHATSGDGGGILAVGSSRLAGIALTIADSTITGNTASTSAGISVRGNIENETSLMRSTVASNSAGSTDAGPGINVADQSRFTVTGSIIAGNTGDDVKLNCGGALTSGGGNVEDGESCKLTDPTDLEDTDPQLQPLLAGVGETPVRPISAVSPAVDLTPIQASACTGTDQRDLGRPQGRGCDAGAYEVDQVPDTAIDSGQSGTIAIPSNTFIFSSTEPDVTFECKLDGPGTTKGVFDVCTSATGYGRLPDGAYTFSVRAVDGTGHTDASPATRSFTVDTTPPDTSITAGPSGPISDRSPSFSFSSPQPGATFQCKLDGPGSTTGTFAACTSPTASALADGTYTFSVRALDAVGNADASPATRSFTVDTAAPSTEIVSGPSGETADASPSFGFSSDGDATFQCRLDGPNGAVHAFGPCTSPKGFNGLAPGAYTFFVRARDAAGNTTTTSRSFTVASPTPPPPPNPTPQPQPQPHQTVVVAPVRGRTLIRLPGTKRFVPLDATKGIPLGSTVDTRRGRVELSAIRRAGRPLETALFYGGIFKVTQSSSVTQLRLVQKLSCSAPAKKASAARKRVRKRRLWGNGKGRFRTRGQYSSATVRGTKWLVQDTCGRTLTRVARGVVTVRDLVRHRTVRVPAGRHYTARRR